MGHVLNLKRVSYLGATMAVTKSTVTLFPLTHLGSSFGANDHRYLKYSVLGELVTINASLYYIYSTSMCHLPPNVPCVVLELGPRREGAKPKRMFY